MDFESILSKNPFIDGKIDGYLRQKDGVDRLYFNSDHVEGAKAGRYHEVDADDEILVKNEDGSSETASAHDFVTGDQFQGFGSPQQRLALLQKAAKYEVRGDFRTQDAQLPVAEDFQGMVDRLDPSEPRVAVAPPQLGSSVLQYLAFRAEDAADSLQGSLHKYFGV